ncbi:MAG TPA: M56 family metallopeptidase [Steroidobacteraceae bacterium]|nr:M56 family metallopeptidase [Steroidobacteraceae bacterium]
MTVLLIEWVARATALVAMVWLVLRVLRVRSPRLERSAWLLVLASCWAMPLLMTLPAVPEITAHQPSWLPQVDLVAVSAAAGGVDWRTALLSVFATVTTLLVLRHSLGILRWRRVQRAASPVSSHGSHLDIRVTPAVSSPATVFSTILVPPDFESWSPQVQRAVIAHESTHVANKDFYVQWLAQLHRCVFWFNPVAWWLANRLSLLSEQISDDAALCETTERAAYAEVLLGFAARRTAGSGQLVSMARERTLGPRIDRILSMRTPVAVSRRRVWMFLAALLPLVGIAGGLQTVAARSREPVAAAGDGHVVLPKSNPTRRLSQPIYPAASLRLGEHGTVVLRLHVLEDGSVADSRIQESSGYPDLDYAALYESYRWQLDPGTVDGVPARMWGRFAVTFKTTP